MAPAAYGAWRSQNGSKCGSDSSRLIRRFSTMVLLFLLLTVTAGCVKDECTPLCRTYRSCVEERAGIPLSEKQSRQFTSACHKVCGFRLRQELLGCYRKVGDSCQGLSRCLIEALSESGGVF